MRIGGVEIRKRTISPLSCERRICRMRKAGSQELSLEIRPHNRRREEHKVINDMARGRGRTRSACQETRERDRQPGQLPQGGEGGFRMAEDIGCTCIQTVLSS